MLVSAEIRWFWRTAPPEGLAEWFLRSPQFLHPVADPELRADEYLVETAHAELGIKIRGGWTGVEIKGLVEHDVPSLAPPPFDGPLDIWTKWTSTRIEIARMSTVRVGKRRWQRVFATADGWPVETAAGAVRPLRGCSVELTEVTTGTGSPWWTFGLEAFGRLETIVGDAADVASELVRRNPPALPDGLRMSYPEWIQQFEQYSGIEPETVG